MAQLNSLFTGTLLTRTLISSVALGLAFGCGVRKEVLTTETGGASNSGGTGGTTDMDASVLVCPSVTGHVTQLPSGACSVAGSCNVIVDAQCGPGINSIPATPPTFNCKCASGNWNCSVIAGGFGLIPCDMDAGPNMGTGGASGVTDAGPSLGTGGANTMLDASAPPYWTSCSETQAMTGDKCSGPFRCGGVDQCTINSRECRNGVIDVMNVTGLDCAQNVGPTAADPNANWSVCSDALANGHAGEQCTFQAGCSRPTTDPCCIEVASCISAINDQDLRLRRERICAPGCQNIDPSTVNQTVVTTCPTGYPLLNPAPPDWPPVVLGVCSGNLVCLDNTNITQDKSISDQSPMLMWCANGLFISCASAIPPLGIAW